MHDWPLPPLSSLPFFLAATNTGPGREGHTHVNITRIIEAVIIAAVAGGVAVYASQQVLASRLDSMEKSFLKLETHVEEKFDQIQQDFYVPKHSQGKR